MARLSRAAGRQGPERAGRPHGQGCGLWRRPRTIGGQESVTPSTGRRHAVAVNCTTRKPTVSNVDDDGGRRSCRRRSAAVGRAACLRSLWRRSRPSSGQPARSRSASATVVLRSRPVTFLSTIPSLRALRSRRGAPVRGRPYPRFGAHVATAGAPCLREHGWPRILGPRPVVRQPPGGRPRTGATLPTLRDGRGGRACRRGAPSGPRR